MGRSAHQVGIGSYTGHIDYISPHSIISDQEHTRNANIEARAIIGTNGNILNLPYSEHTVDHFAEDNMFSVQKTSWLCSYEKLG